MDDRTCSVDGCANLLVGGAARGMCGKHYQRWRRTGTTDPGNLNRATARPRASSVRCSEMDCDRLVDARGLCTLHYSRLRSPQQPDLVCEMCGAAFKVKGARTKCCTPECSAAYRKRYQRVNAKSRRVPVPTFSARCLLCHSEFQANRYQFRYCSKECRKFHRYSYRDPYLPKRAAMVRAATVEKFARSEILDRDGWVCQICGLAIDQEMKYPEPGFGSVDHIIPISKGGLHSRANCQAAHLVCNMRKQDKILSKSATA